jgi:FkbM family methyltransferase
VFAIETLVPEGRIYIDIGAWIGPTVLVAARRAGKVIAYEPDPVSSEELLANLALNDLQHVDVQRVALWTADGEIPFGPGSSKELGQSTSSLMYNQRDGVSVRCRDIRQELVSPALQDCSLLKIDVEGAEYVIVPHIAAYFQSVGPALLLSTHGLGHSARREGRFGRLVEAAELVVKRARLLWALLPYKYAYVDYRRDWLDKAARWKPIPKWSLMTEAFRLRNRDYLFTNDARSVDNNRGQALG